MQREISPKIVALTFGVLVICFGIGFYIYAAWTGPKAPPPQENASAPINVGSENQTKQGNLTIGTATIKGDGSISTNLNSDKVDNLHSADLLAQSAGGTVFTRWGATTCPAGWALLYSGRAFYLKTTETAYNPQTGSANNIGVAVAGPICSSGITSGSPDSDSSLPYTYFFNHAGYYPTIGFPYRIDCAVCYK